MLKNKKLLIVAIIFLILTIMPTIVKAGATQALDSGSTGSSMDPIKNPDNFKPGDLTDTDTTKLKTTLSPILAIISVVGVITAVATLGILGIKYMIGSVEEKAEYKKTMTSYIIGSIMLFSISGVIGIIYSLTKSLNI